MSPPRAAASGRPLIPGMAVGMKGKGKPVAAPSLPRTGMSIYSYEDDLASHWVRIVAAEKDIDGLHVEYLKRGVMAEDLLTLDSTHTVPTLADREVVLNSARIATEYLDERYPHPPMMPVEPSARARLRLALYRIELDLFPLVAQIYAGPASSAQKARRQLQESLIAGAPLFAARPYFLSGDYSCVDALWSALLWRLPSLGIDVGASAGKIIQRYSERVFSRQAFARSLTPAERALRG